MPPIFKKLKNIGRNVSVRIKTAVLLHGYNVNEENWVRVVWGVPPDRPGRIPTAIAVALEEDVDSLILFGSSVGKYDSFGKWKSSGRWMRELLEERFEELKKFAVFPILQDFSREYFQNIFKLIEDQERPATTAGEMQALNRIAKEKGIQKIIAVSSPDHISRVIRDGLIAFAGTSIALYFSVRASATLYTENDGITPPENASIDNVIIIEPRMGNFFKLLPEIFNYSWVMREINEIVKKWRNQGTDCN